MHATISRIIITGTFFLKKKKERNNNWSLLLNDIRRGVIILARYEDEKEGGSGQIDAILADYVLSDVVNPALNAILTNRIKRKRVFFI